MPKLLYLDTARLGQMSIRARRASVDFARFASEFGGSLYSSDFLHRGHAALPTPLRHEFPGLATWSGLAGLKRRLRLLANAHSSTPVITAARSTNLMVAAARLMAGTCRNILISDLTWPHYERILMRTAKRKGVAITKIRLKKAIFRKRTSPETLVAKMSAAYLRHQCDGLFLPLVNHLGVRLPVRQLVKRIRQAAPLRFVTVDGAQAFNHVDLELNTDYSDLLITGCHKWLRAFHPMGVAFCGGDLDYTLDSLHRWQHDGSFNDPLVQFAEELEGRHTTRFGETVSVLPLLTANAATVDALESERCLRNENRIIMRQVARGGTWNCWETHPALFSRIMLLSPFILEKFDGEDLTQRLLIQRGVSLTRYPSGLTRVSLPDHVLSAEEKQRLMDLFAITTRPSFRDTLLSLPPSEGPKFCGGRRVPVRPFQLPPPGS